MPRPPHHRAEKEVEENNYETKFQVSDEGKSSTFSPRFASIHYAAGKLQMALPSLIFPLALVSVKVINAYRSHRGGMTKAHGTCPGPCQARPQNPSVSGCPVMNTGTTSAPGGSTCLEFTHPEEHIVAHKGKFMQSLIDTF